VLGAARAGITEIVLPRENEPELEDLPEEVRSRLAFHPVQTLDEVLAVALLSPEARLVNELVGSKR
jgi:ATP-dependent Lon protease